MLSLLGVPAQDLDRIVCSLLDRLVVDAVMLELLLNTDHLAVKCWSVLMVMQELLTDMDDNEHISQIDIIRIVRCPVNSDCVIVNCSVVLVGRFAHRNVLLLGMVQRLPLDLFSVRNAGRVGLVGLHFVLVAEIIFSLVRMNLRHFLNVLMLSLYVLGVCLKVGVIGLLLGVVL